MRKFQIFSAALLMSAVMSGPVLLSGCYGQVRYYDTTYGDYHPWNHNEVVYYGRWETETHRDHVDFKNRSKADQDEYWKWRHSQH